jgi:peptide/nickel transport system permease protein
MATAQSAAETATVDSVSQARGSWLRLVLRRLLANPSAITGFFFIALLVALALLAPLIARYPPNAIDILHLNQPPSGAHWFGTDNLGRDVWSRCLYGGRVSLPAGLGVVAIGLGIGTPLGILAGFSEGFFGNLIMRAMDILLSFPGIVLALGIVAILGPGLVSVVVAVGITNVPYFARIARGSTLSARETDYVMAARALGGGRVHLMSRHILVNVVDPLIVLGTLSLGGAILATAALSYLGLGTQLPTSDWGTMLTSGFTHMYEAWSEVTFPGLAIVVAVLGINLSGDGLADALNPHIHGDS